MRQRRVPQEDENHVIEILAEAERLRRKQAEAYEARIVALKTLLSEVYNLKEVDEDMRRKILSAVHEG